MATAAQTIANQANAQHSTGPRTAEGKARASQNALRHGLTSRHLVIREDEREEFEALQAELSAELRPEGAVEGVVFRELVHAAWNLARFRRIEAKASTGAVADFYDAATTAVLDRLGRYQARTQRAYYRALQELRTLQTNRALRAFKLKEEEEAQVPAITDINKLTKRSQSEVTAKALNMALKMTDFEVGAFRVSAMRERVAANSQPGSAQALRL